MTPKMPENESRRRAGRRLRGADSAVMPTRVELRAGSDGSVLAISGPLNVETAAAARRQIETELAAARVSRIEVDASGIDHGDMSGMSLLYELTEGRLTPGVRAGVAGLKPEFARLLAAFPSRESIEELATPPVRKSLPAEIGAETVSVLADLREQLTFLGSAVQAFAAALRRPRTMRWQEVGVVFEKAGVNAVPIVSLISFLTGVIIAFESAQPLAMFGAQAYTANIIGIVMIREFGPIFTAIILAGRSGSAFAAEIGTMKVNEELDALTTMGLEPMRFLVVQRILAGTLLMPALTAFAMLTGVAGGVLVMLGMGFPFAQIWNHLASSVGVSDVLVGTFKAVVFGAIVSGLGCLRGMQTKQGPSAVGDSATRAVVSGILMIIVVDAFFAVLTNVLHV
jgi:phospholipid/cholesterol/gamma-HCH transport system permease protein